MHFEDALLTVLILPSSVKRLSGAREAAAELARDVALERTDDLAFGAAFGGPPRDVGASAGVQRPCGP